MAVDRSGNLVVVGAFDGVMDLGGVTLSSAPRDYSYAASLSYTEGAYDAATFAAQYDGLHSLDVFVAKFDPSGHVLFAKAFGDAGGQFATSVALDAAGDLYLTGNYESTINFGGGDTLTTGVPLTPYFGPAYDAFVAGLDAQGRYV
jgi:hypothetical protein